MANHKLTKKDIEKLLIDYQPLIRKAAFSIPILPHTSHLTADDYVQEIILGTFNQLKKYTPYHRCSAKTFIFNAIKNARNNTLNDVIARSNCKGRKETGVSLFSTLNENKHTRGGIYDADYPEYDPPSPKPSPKEIVQNKLLNRRLNHYFVCLSPRETDILCAYYGFNGYVQMNYTEIAREQKVSLEYIRVILARALRKVRLLIKEENDRERKEQRRQNRVNSKVLSL